MSLSLRISLNEEEGHKWYTNFEIISGKVLLDLKSSVEVTDITVVLYGVSETSLTRIDDFGQKFTDHVEDTSIFLSMQSRLFPPSGDEFGAKYSLREGSHSWPFEFQMPGYTSLADRKQLPPSFSDVDEDMASIRYYIKCTLNVTGSSSLRSIGSSRSSTSMLPIVFLPSDDTNLDMVPTYGIFYSQQSRVISSRKTMSGLISRLFLSLAHDKAPTCTGIGLFTVRSELLLTPGLKFSCNIEAATETNEEIDIVGVKIELVSRTYVRAKNVDKTVESVRILLHKNDCNLMPGDLLSQMGNPVMRLPDSIPPSFNFTNIRRDYRLEFKIKWTHRPSSVLVHKALMSRKVWVRSGMYSLPNYETGEVARATRDFPQAKWYFSAAK